MFTPEYFKERVALLDSAMQEQDRKIQQANQEAQLARTTKATLHGARQEAQRQLDILEGRKPMSVAETKPEGVVGAAADVKMDAEVTKAEKPN